MALLLSYKTKEVFLKPEKSGNQQMCSGFRNDLSGCLGESSDTIRRRVQAARNIQQNRFSNESSDIVCNAEMHVGEIKQFCKLQDESQSLMRAAMTQHNLSARAYCGSIILKLRMSIILLAKRIHDLSIFGNVSESGVTFTLRLPVR